MSEALLNEDAAHRSRLTAEPAAVVPNPWNRVKTSQTLSPVRTTARDVGRISLSLLRGMADAELFDCVVNRTPGLCCRDVKERWRFLPVSCFLLRHSPPLERTKPTTDR